VQAKALSNQALYAVTLNRVASGLDGHCCPQTRVLQFIGHGQYRHKTIAGLEFAMLEHPLVLCCLQQAIRNRVTRCSRTQGGGVQTARRARPFARRALITRRPLLVRIRARKPWVRLRLRLLG